MPEPKLQPDTAAIRRDLVNMTRRWPEIGQRVMFELRALAEHRQPQTGRFTLAMMDDAVEWAANLNQLGCNIYTVRNPIRGDYTGSAKDTDIVAAFALWADCDDGEAAANVRNFVGPKWTSSVITGTVPSTRVHTYWELAEPITDMAAWRATQAAIADTFQSDPAVINPSRVMRVGGTVSFPSDQKKERGYISEICTIRTEYDDARAPVPFETMQRLFAGATTAQRPASTSFAIDTGADYAPPLDRERMAIQAMSGQDWHNAVIRIVASYVARGLSDSEIHALTDPLTLAGYTVDQTRAEVQVAIEGARRKGWTPAVAPAALLAPQFDAERVDPQTGEIVAWPTPYSFFDEEAMPRRRWIYGKHYLRSFVSVLASAGGIGKTSLQIVEALAIATGRPLLGEDVVEPCNVWIINLEDPMEEMQRRILAAMRHYKIKPKDVRGRLFVDAGREFSLTFAVQTREGITPNTALVDHLIKRIPELGIGCVFIDPFVGAHMINENDNMAVNAVVGQIREVADKTQCAIGLVHHIRKGNGEDANIDSVRGAGSLIGAARAARVINKVSTEAADSLGIGPKEAIGLFRVDDGKANLAPPASAAVYRRMEGVQIGNGEWIGVATPFKLPDDWEGMDVATVNDMLRMIDLGPVSEDGTQEFYSLRPQDKERWVGNIILTYAFDNPAHTKNPGQAKAIVRQWQENGLIEEFEYRSEKQRKDRKGVRSKGRVGDQE